MKISTWILTYKRPVALNRLVKNLNHFGIVPSIMNNDPSGLSLDVDSVDMVGDIITNELNAPESSSWCARSWNSIFIKAFHEQKADGVICIQDDCNISSGFRQW